MSKKSGPSVMIEVDHENAKRELAEATQGLVGCFGILWMVLMILIATFWAFEKLLEMTL